MVLITAFLALLVNVFLFAICLLVALLTAERKRQIELRRLDDRIDRLTERVMTPTERARRAARQHRANERHRQALGVYQD